MIRIHCPHCGLRDQTEFTYGGDATRAYPGLDNEARDDWNDYVFLRDNPRGRHAEFWHHVQGCRRWLRVQRDTLSHRIFSVTDASEPMHEWPEEEAEPEEAINAKVGLEDGTESGEEDEELDEPQTGIEDNAEEGGDAETGEAEYPDRKLKAGELDDE